MVVIVWCVAFVWSGGSCMIGFLFFLNVQISVFLLQFSGGSSSSSNWLSCSQGGGWGRLKSFIFQLQTYHVWGLSRNKIIIYHIECFFNLLFLVRKICSREVSRVGGQQGKVGQAGGEQQSS